MKRDYDEVLKARVEAAFDYTELSQKEFCEKFNEWCGIKNRFSKTYEHTTLSQSQLSKAIKGSVSMPFHLIIFFVEYWHMNMDYFTDDSWDMFIEPLIEYPTLKEEIKTSMLNRLIAWLKSFLVIILLFLSFNPYSQLLTPNQKELYLSFTKFKVGSNNEIFNISKDINISFVHKVDIYWQFCHEGDCDKELFKWKVKGNTTVFYNSYAVFTWFTVGNANYLKFQTVSDSYFCSDIIYIE